MFKSVLQKTTTSKYLN